jgi:uncharacterized LabA/DUF88 family protein
MERVSILIDGCNFYYGLRSINRKYTDVHFHFEKYCKSLCGKKRKLVKIYYYNAPLKLEKNPSIYQKQQKMFSRLQNSDLFAVRLCKRQKRNGLDGSDIYVVKEDDIYLAVDMLSGAYENEYDTAIIISGDGDFRPVVEKVKSLLKNVENIFFEGSSSLALVNVCDISKPLTRKDVKKNFFPEKPKS